MKNVISFLKRCFYDKYTEMAFSFLLYWSFIRLTFDIPISPKEENFIIYIILASFFCLSLLSINRYFDNLLEISSEPLSKRFRNKLKKIIFEIAKFVPICMILKVFTAALIRGVPVNQASLNEYAVESPISYFVLVVIIGPIFEEYLFRVIPAKFLRNKAIYIGITTVIFAAAHVVDEPQPFQYIWFYMLVPWYWSYRYYETKDALIPIALHGFSNALTIFF